jgi:Putative 2OG-Fe(II) oxygenase
MTNIFSCNFPNYGFVGADLLENEYQPILDESKKIQQDFSAATSMNSTLVGHIQHEYLMKDTHDHIESIVIPLCKTYKHAFVDSTSYLNKELKLSGAWINFSQKYEFNPLHDHTGVFSFVIFVKIPYTIEQEKQFVSTVPTNLQIPGSFVFYYTDALGAIRPWTIPADNTYEKKIIVFPASMRHAVYPFYSSNDYRITVSGNISYT